MPTTTLRPTSSSGPTYNLIGGTVIHTVLNDQSDATMAEGGGPGILYQVGFSGFTLPAGAVIKSVQPFMRGRCNAIDAPSWAGEVGKLTINGVQTTVATGGIGAAWSWNTTPWTNNGGLVLTAAYSEAMVNGVSLTADGTGAARVEFSELWMDVIYASAPTCSAVTPSGAITTTRQPTVGWTFNQGADGSGGQTYFRVKVFTAAVYGGGGFDPLTSSAAYDSGVINSASVSHALSAPLANGVTYKAYVLVYQTTNGVNQPATAYTAGSAFNIAITVPTPTAVTPTASSTVTTSRPTLGASVGAMTGGSLMRREWLFATDAGFTANLVTVTEVVGNLTATPSAPYAFPALPARLFQGVWFVKARALDQDGIYGSYTAGQSFTVSHPPTTASRAPAGGGTIQYSTTPQVTWAFSESDTDDFQLKYQVQMWKTSAPGTVLDSGVVTSGNLFYTVPSGIDVTWKNTELRWIVKVWDQDNVAGSFSIENTFYLRDLPVVTVTNPGVGGVITTGAPLCTWTDSFSGGATQAQFKVDIIRASVVQATSGWTAGTALTWQCPSPVVTVGPTHQITVSVVDSNGLTGSTTNNFTATYAAATTPVFTVSGAQYAVSGLNVIDWTSAVADANFLSWKVLRRNVGTTTWTKLLETQTVGTRNYRDFLAPSQQAVEYVVVQTDISIGVQVESAYVPQQITGIALRYMLVCPTNEALNVVLYQVHTDSFGDELESSTINLIGRGRRVEYGSRFGEAGSLTSSLRDIVGGLTARQQRLAIEALRIANQVVYFRNPFGDVFQVSMPSAKFDRVAGVGLLEYLELSLDYVEITA
jgi:hypothetical protein